MLAAVLTGVLQLLIGVLVGGIAIYLGVPLGANRATPTIEDAFVTAAAGTALSLVLTLLFGWIPFFGVVLPAVAWVGTVGQRTEANALAAVGVGLVAWATTAVMTTGITVLALGGVQ